MICCDDTSGPDLILAMYANPVLNIINKSRSRSTEQLQLLKWVKQIAILCYAFKYESPYASVWINKHNKSNIFVFLINVVISVVLKPLIM